MCRVLVTAKTTSPTKDSSPAAPAAAAAVLSFEQAASLAFQFKQLASGPAAHHRSLRHVFGLTAAGPLVSQTPRPAASPALLNRQTRPGIISLRRSLVSTQLSSPDQGPRPSHPAYKPRLTAPAHGFPAPPESSHPRPPASLPRPPRHGSSKTSLGFISTPLIWQGRKRPTGGRRPASTRAPPRPSVHITKPAVPPSELKTTSRPTYTRQTTGFRYISGYTQAPGLKNSTGRLHASTPESPTMTPDSKLSPASGVSVSSQASSPWQRRDDGFDTKVSSSVEGASPLSLSSSSLLSSSSPLSNRKNKPVAPQWSLLSLSGGENQTVTMGNWTDPLKPLGDEYSLESESFVYDLTEFAEEGGSFSLYEFDAAYSLDEPVTVSPAIIGPDAKNHQSFNQSDSHGTLLPFSQPFNDSEERSEHLLMQAHFHNDSVRLLSGLTTGSKLSLTYLQDGLNLEAVTLSKSQIATVTVSQTLTGAQTHHRVSNNTSSSGQRLEENSNSQAATQQLEILTFQPTPSLLIPPFSSFLFVQPTPSLPRIPLSSSTFLADKILPKQIISSSVPQKEDIALISESSPSLHPLDSMYEVDIAGIDVELAVAKSRLFSNLYISTELYRPPLSSYPAVFPKMSSNTFTSSLDIPHYSSSTAHPLTPPLPSPAFMSAPPPFTSSPLSASLYVSPNTVTLQIPTPPPLYTSNTLPPLPVSRSLWPNALPLPPFAPQQPSPFLPSSSQQSEQRLSETDGVVESDHAPESDGVSMNFQPSLLSFLSLSSNLQRDFGVTRVETASLLSLPLFSKAQSESQMAVAEGAVLPEYRLLSAERSTNNISELFRSQLPYPVDNLFLDAQSGILVDPVSIVSDPSFDQINATSSGLSLVSLTSSSVILTPDLQPQMQPSLSQLDMIVPELDSSPVLWPSSNAASLSVTHFLSHPSQRYLSNIYTLPHLSQLVNKSDIGFTSLPAAGIWAFERTPSLLQANVDRSQDLHSASSATSLSLYSFLSSPLSHHFDRVSLTVSSETLPTDMMMQVDDVTELKVGEKTAVSTLPLSHDTVIENSLLLAETVSSGSQDRHTSNLTFNRVPWRLQHTISHLHTDHQVNTAAGAESSSRGSQALPSNDDAFNHPTFSLSNPSVMAPTQTLALHSNPSAQFGTTTPQHASGLNYSHRSGLTQTNTEHPRHTHSSPQTQTLSQSAFHAHMSEFLDASEELQMREMPGQETQYEEAHDDAGGLQQQSFYLTSSVVTPPLLSSSIVSSLSLAATLTPPFPSLQLSPIYPVMPSSITVSPLPLSSFITPTLSPVLPSWVALQPAGAASVANAVIGSLSPTRPTAGFDQSITSKPPLDNYLQSFQRFTTNSVSQSAQPSQQFIELSQSLPLHEALSLPDDKLKSNHSQPLVSAEVYDRDEYLRQLANNLEVGDASRFVTGPVLSPETSNNHTAAGKQSHLSALFDPADVVPKIHIANECDSAAGQASSAVNTNDSVTPDVMLNAATGLQPNENLNPEAVLNTQSFLSVSAQPTGPPVIPNPLHTSGLNIPSSTPASRSSTGSSIDALDHGIISGLAELSPPGIDNHTTNTAGLKYISKSNATTVIKLKDSPSAPVEMTDTVKAKNATTLIENGSMASQGNVTGHKPTPDLSISKSSLNSSPSVSNHSGNQSSGVNGAMNPDYNDVKDVHLSTALPVIVDAHHFITTKHSSPTAPFKAVSVSAISGGSGGLRKTTVHATPGSPTVDLTSKPALPCQCKQRFHFTCLCGLSSGNSMSCSTKHCRRREYKNCHVCQHAL